MKASNIKYWPVHYKFHFIWLILFFILLNSCKRESNCNDSDRNDYFVIPASIKPLILNKRGETLVFSNLMGDTVSFYCSIDTQYNKLVYDEFYGSGDCAPKHRKYSETHEFYYYSAFPYFKFIKIIYFPDIEFNGLTYFDMNISDSIKESDIIENLLKRPIMDSIYYSGKFYSGSYFTSKNVLYNQEIGIIKFIESNNITWQLIHKQ